jgi:L-rhamnose mutarotase
MGAKEKTRSAGIIRLTDKPFSRVPNRIMKQFCLACDLKDDEKLIKAYEEDHKNVWPEIKDSLQEAGVLDMEIYRTGNRLFMIIQVRDDFSFSKKEAMDLANPIVQKWEARMSEFQKQIPWADKGVKWLTMERIFKLDERK